MASNGTHQDSHQRETFPVRVLSEMLYTERKPDRAYQNPYKRESVEIWRGNCTPNQMLACFVLLSQNYQHLFEKWSYSKLSKELKDGIEIVIGRSGFKLFWSITQVPLGLVLILSSLENLNTMEVMIILR